MLLLFLLRAQVTASYRPMRGQVVIQEIAGPIHPALWTPTPKPREVTTHTGKVLALGPPALYGGHEVPHGFAVGDLVLYRFTFLEKVSLNEWNGVPAHWIPQADVTAVWEERQVCEACSGAGFWTYDGPEDLTAGDEVCEECEGEGYYQ